MSLTHLDSTLGCIVSSTTLDSPARNSALTLRCPRGRPSEGGVLSRARPGPGQVVSAIDNQTSGRKMFTFIGAIWLRRFQPTLWEPAPVSHLVMRSQDEPAQQPNQLGEGSDVAEAAKLRVIDNAVLSDSSHS
jgi:hypothetical protein